MGPYVLLGAVVLLLGLTVVVPTLRAWRRFGTWPVVLQREADPFQRVMGVALIALLLGLPLWGVLYALLGPERLGVLPLPSAVAAAGWLAMTAGAAVVVVAQAQMGASFRIGIDDRPTALVSGGLFGLVRNPIFSGLLLSMAGAVLVAPSGWTIMGWLMAASLIALQVRLEERHLLALHGDGYALYAARVGRFLPHVGRLRRDGPSPVTGRPKVEGGRP